MPFFTLAQDYKIKGHIKDSLGNAIPNAIIIAKAVDDHSILSFFNSTRQGNFSLSISKDVKHDSIWLSIKHMSYQSFQIKLPLKNTIQNITLFSKVQQLEAVLLKSQKTVEIKGDTITYKVSGLKKVKDYSIEEVINRIPGVDINENGQIRYKDKPISHLYINGVDLLEGRYNIATQGIPANAVKEIDIMSKHNHARIDIGRTESDNVAFNLKIKEDVSLVFGSIKAEAGAPFMTGLIDATPIYLKDKFQSIASLKSNNTGKNLDYIGENLTIQDQSINSLKLVESQIIRPPNMSGVILSDKFWLDNDSYTITNDALHKMSDSVLLKWNLSYINQLNKIRQKTTAIYLINNDSSVVVNKSRNQLRFQRFQTSFRQEINKNNFYLKNNTAFYYHNKEGFENITLNDSNIQSQFQNNRAKFINTTSLKSLVGQSNILENGLVLEYEKQEEALSVNPPVFESIFTNTRLNKSTRQEAIITKFNIAAFSNFAFDWLNQKWNAKQGIQYNYFTFESSLLQLPDFEHLEFPFKGDFSYQKLMFSSTIDSKLMIGKFKFAYGASADLFKINTNEINISSLDQSETFFFFQPFVFSKYKINSQWDLGLSLSQDVKISDYSELFQAFILSDYNSLVQNPEEINITRNQSINTSLNYTQILKRLLISLRGRWQSSTSDFTFANTLNDQGFFITRAIERPNTFTNYNLSLNFSKGFKSAISIGVSYAINYSENELFFNSELIEAINRRHNVGLDLSWDNGTWYSLEYTSQFNFGETQLQSSQISNRMFVQTLNLDFYTSLKTRLHFGLQSSKTNTSSNGISNTNTLFDSAFYYKPSNKLVLNASLLNIFNSTFFSTSNGSLNGVNISEFSLRPRQFTLGLTYSL